MEECEATYNADFTIEAEYIAACEVAKKAIWLRKFWDI